MARPKSKAAPDKLDVCNVCGWPSDDPAHYSFHAMRVADQDYLRGAPKRLEAIDQASTKAQKQALGAEAEEAYRAYLLQCVRLAAEPRFCHGCTIKERIECIMQLLRSERDDDLAVYEELQPRLTQLLEMQTQGMTVTPSDWHEWAAPLAAAKRR